MADPKLPTNNDNLVNKNSLSSKRGFANSHLYDPTNQYEYEAALCEKVYNGEANTWIVLGRDRPGGLESGYGGQGELRAGAIDIVAGRLSSFDARKTRGKKVSSNFGADAARVYISQKSDIDVNLSIPDGKTGSSIGKSAVAIKADAVRIVARESLKLVTNTDAKLSTGYEAMLGQGVQLIAKNNDNIDMQPIPKGDNLVAAFEGVCLLISKLNGIVQSFVNFQREYNIELAKHQHKSPFFGLDTSVPPEVIQSHITTLQNFFNNLDTDLGLHSYDISRWQMDYIVPISSPTARYINSLYHTLN